MRTGGPCWTRPSSLSATSADISARSTSSVRWVYGSSGSCGQPESGSNISHMNCSITGDLKPFKGGKAPAAGEGEGLKECETPFMEK